MNTQTDGLFVLFRAKRMKWWNSQLALQFLDTFEHEIGASEGKSSRWMRVEESGGTIHGHPISEAEYRKLTK